MGAKKTFSEADNSTDGDKVQRYSLQIEIPVDATDSNRILGVNKYAKHAVFNKVKAHVFKECRGRAPLNPLENFKISVTRYSSRTLDWDNFVASLKPYIDALKIAGVIRDDNWSYIKSIATNQTISKERKLVITVSET